jgi:hypothetical protein
MFSARLTITPDRLPDLSVMQMVDHVDYLDEMRRAAADG